MTRFLGEFDVPVDQKGRIFIPAELRRKIVPEDGETLVVTRGLDGCLSVHPQHAWGEIASKMAGLSQTEQNVRLYYRGVLSQAAEVKIDRQGRATVPRKLLDRVGITDRMVIIGALEKLEFWEPTSWQAYLQKAEEALEQVAESLDL